ncbi:MAG: permease [Chloroflexi bacterium]|nr:MAG: permease [Chloroflexota bacterium]MBL1193717.1 permease [Chloroflexota bacterium]NOH11010.1 permease [Chloroflexota bacterium]
MLIFELLEAGWLSLLDYLAAHVILCLIPAFFIAGGLSALIPKEAVTRYLGPDASKWVSYPAAAVGGFVLAVCSCTILPLFAGIWRRGAGLGPAVTFLFVGPAVNILAIAYTGAAIGMDIAIARIVLSIIFGIGIGLTMAFLFRTEEQQVDASMFGAEAKLRAGVWAFFGLMILFLVAGTLQIELLTKTYFSIYLDWDLPVALLSGLESLHLSLQGALIILLLMLTAPLAWKGLNDVWEGSNGWTVSALGAVVLTLLIAAPQINETASIQINITGRAIAVVGLLVALVVVARQSLTQDELGNWLWESWKFVKQIFPLLILGVFAAGVIKFLIPEIWVQTLAGENTLLANLFGVLFGVFMYFPTLVEVPIARMFLDMGMHRGPLLAYLMADPALSVQSILVTGKIMGRQKTVIYVALVSVFSTLAGYIFGLVLSIV